MKDTQTKLIYISSVFFLLALMSLYVFQIYGLTKETYLVEKYQKKIDAYTQESNNLEYRFLQNNSFHEIETLASEFDFKQAERISYIEVLGSEVVVK